MASSPRPPIPLPPKPNGTVTVGQPIKVRVNCFNFNNFPTGKIYHYDCTITRSGKGTAPEDFEARPSKSGQATVRGMPERISRGVIAWMERNQCYSPRAGYDGNKSLYSPQPLIPGGSNAPLSAHNWSNLPVPEDGNADSTATSGPRYDVDLKQVNVIDLDALKQFCEGRSPDNEAVQTCIMALNTIFNHEQWLKYPSKRTSFFDPSIQKEQVAHAQSTQGGRGGRGGGRGGPRGGRGGPRGGGFGGGGGPSSADTLGYAVNRGVEIWRGYYTSIRPVSGGVVLNVDVTHMPFLTANSLNRVMASLLNLMDDNQLTAALTRYPSYKDLKQVLLNVRISYIQGDQKVHRVIKEVGRKPASSQTFELDGQTVSIAEYWSRQYNVRLRHPEWPCVRVTKNAWIPIECCQLEVGNKFKASLTPEQIAGAIRFTTMKPAERDSFIRRIDCIRPEVNPILRDANMSIAPEPMTIDGAVLNKPTPLFGSNDPGHNTTPFPVGPQGSWNTGKFTKPAVLNHWIVAVFAGPNQISQTQVESSIGTLVESMRHAGIDCRNLTPAIHFCELRDSNGHWDVNTSFKQWGGDYQKRSGSLPEFILCYIGTTGATTPEHQAIKKFGDKDFGVATQCVSVAKLMKGNLNSRNYWANLCLKINPKLRNIQNPRVTGHNHYLDSPSWAGIDNEPTMIVGADCTHPAPGSREPSFAAVVGSIDRNFVQYTSTYGVQQSRLETIENMEEKMLKLLKQFSMSNQRVPRRLIVYRDGVSEGQYQEILAREVPEVRSALEKHVEIFKQNVPNAPVTPCDITYVICAKRHHIRFKPANDRDGDRNGNVPAGTYVDRHVTLPNTWSFYLLSHQGLLGTSRPTLYTVIKDDNKLDLNQMAQLTNSLCYIYARATRAVSIAAPAYYAHHACTRAKELSAPPSGDDAASQYSRESDESAERAQLLDKYVAHCGDPHSNMVNTLYFM